MYRKLSHTWTSLSMHDREPFSFGNILTKSQEAELQGGTTGLRHGMAWIPSAIHSVARDAATQTIGSLPPPPPPTSPPPTQPPAPGPTTQCPPGQHARGMACFLNHPPHHWPVGHGETEKIRYEIV